MIMHNLVISSQIERFLLTIRTLMRTQWTSYVSISYGIKTKNMSLMIMPLGFWGSDPLTHYV